MEEWIRFSWISWAPWGQRPLFLYLWIVVFVYSVNSTLNYSASRWESFTGWRKIMLASSAFLDSICIHWASLITRSVQRSSQYWAHQASRDKPCAPEPTEILQTNQSHAVSQGCLTLSKEAMLSLPSSFLWQHGVSLCGPEKLGNLTVLCCQPDTFVN